MISLEAIRISLMNIDDEITAVEECIRSNREWISVNFDGIENSDRFIEANEEELESQLYRLEALQYACRYVQGRLD